jgi:hypothetical protein
VLGRAAPDRRNAVSMVYVVIVLGIVLFATLVFNILVGSGVLRFKGALQFRVHKYAAYAMLAIACVHVFLALGVFIFQWFY